jgi:hypothetical protein
MTFIPFTDTEIALLKKHSFSLDNDHRATDTSILIQKTIQGFATHLWADGELDDNGDFIDAYWTYIGIYNTIEEAIG